MDRKEEKQYLAARIDRMIGLQDSTMADLPCNTREVKALLAMAEQVQAVLLPVEPHPSFRRRLRGDLLLEAQRREMEPHGGVLRQHRKGILIGAAAAGSVVSMVGVFVAFLLRWRHGRAPHTAG